MHDVLPADHQFVEAPEGVLLTHQVHKKQRGYLGHALAVANLK